MEVRALVLSCVVVLFAPASASAEEAASVEPQAEIAVVPPPPEDVATPAAPTAPVAEEPTRPSVVRPRASALGIYVPLPDGAQPDGRSLPDFGLSIGLHVSAAIIGSIGSAGTLFGALLTASCFGGSNCVMWFAMAITSGILVTAAFAIGISASAVHAHTRSGASTARLQLLPPSLWADATGGGGTLGFRF